MSFDYGVCLLRLTDVERQKLQLVSAALKVSEYTDDVDDFRRPANKDRRILDSMLELFDTITGLAIASDAVPRAIKDALLSGDTSVELLVPLLEDLFEVIRRHKRLNPYEHRGEYGKVLMVLQDVQKSSIQRALKISSPLVIPCRTVRGALAEIGCLALLSDRDFLASYLRATGEAKRAGMALLVDRYAGGGGGSGSEGEDPRKRAVLEHCLYSADDVRQLTLSNINPLRELFGYVRDEFERMDPNDKYAISIKQGRGGACFTHSHSVHYQYVEESLKLWETVQRRILPIWEAAESDMLIDGRGQYDFVNTGQGFHRMCRAPKSYAAMSSCVRSTDDFMGGWIGIKVIHLGDHDVPNPLVFIDKYTIIPRIVQPIVTTLRQLRRIFAEENGATSAAAHPNPNDDDHVAAPAAEDIDYPGLRNLLRARYGSYGELRLMILSDFFKYAFDGSGDDGGSCIDGRLTSAWNWCHQLEKKPYYDAFVLTGFTGFD